MGNLADMILDGVSRLFLDNYFTSVENLWKNSPTSPQGNYT
ncbi:MAG: hypothetical protein V7K50_27470 [Nostoc sp.]